LDANCALLQQRRGDPHMICIVEKPNVTAIETTREFKDVYHVLRGALSALSGIGPDDLSKGLLTRIAIGLPVVSDLDYLDEITMHRALEGRREL
jgi:recombination protein RecR